MKKEVELLQTQDSKKLYEQFSRAVLDGFKCIKSMPKMPKHYSTFNVALSALKIARKNIYGMAIKFCSYTDGEGTSEILSTKGDGMEALGTFEQLVKEIEKMKKNFKCEDIGFSVKNEICLKDFPEK
jgi:hypothetical protein